MLRRWTGLFLASVLGCVPNGPSTTAGAGGTSTPTSRPKPPPRPAPPATSQTAVANSAALPPVTSGSPSSSSSASGAPSSLPLGARFEDTFERSAIGENWRTTSPVWRIEGGRLCGKGARNHPIWLARKLPANVRIEFDALSQSPEGDIKAEVFGDGRSAATAVSYTNATSYLTLFGGWKNSFHVLARIDEHAPNRPEIRIVPGSDEPRERPVVANQVYHFRVERADGRTLSWWVDDVLMFRFADPEPLSGPGHDHLGFNDWDVPVCFDNLKVLAL